MYGVMLTCVCSVSVNRYLYFIHFLFVRRSISEIEFLMVAQIKEDFTIAPAVCSQTDQKASSQVLTEINVS